MAINFPTSLDTTTQPSAGNVVDSARIAKLIQMVEALEAKVGVNSSAVTTSLDYKVANAAGGSNCVAPDLNGLKMWSSDPYMITGNAANFNAAGQLQVYRVWSGTAQTITSLGFIVGSAGAGSSVYLALYSAAGTLLSQTGAIASTATGFVSGALGASQAVAASTAYYIGIWTTGGTPPAGALATSSVSVAAWCNANRAAPNLRVATTNNTGLTTTAPGTIGTMTSSGITFVVAGL